MYLDYNQQLPLKPNVDSQGSRIYKDQVHDLDSEPALIVLQILKNSILFNECMFIHRFNRFLTLKLNLERLATIFFLQSR